MQGDTHSFVVRIWHEALDDWGNITAWRGSIEQVGDDHRAYFLDLDEVARYIERWIGLQPQAAPSTEDEAKRGPP